MRKPDFFIVGAPRCGTTAMHSYLRQHPEIFMPRLKAPNFFGTDLCSPFFLREEHRYLSLFAEAQQEKRAGEASVWYLYSNRAASEIKAFCPFADIIIMLRNPVDMMQSLYSEALFTGVEHIGDFPAALDAERERKRGLYPPAEPYPVEVLWYREVAKYTPQVRRYLDTFGREQVQVIIFDDLAQETARVYRTTCEFLGVSPDFQPEFPIVNANKRVRSTTVRGFLRSSSSSGVRRLGRMLLPRPLRGFIHRSIRRFNVKSVPRKPLAAQLREQLNKECAPDVEALSELLGQDLTAWCS